MGCDALSLNDTTQFDSGYEASPARLAPHGMHAIAPRAGAINNVMQLFALSPLRRSWRPWVLKQMEVSPEETARRRMEGQWYKQRTNLLSLKHEGSHLVVMDEEGSMTQLLSVPSRRAPKPRVESFSQWRVVGLLDALSGCSGRGGWSRRRRPWRSTAVHTDTQAIEKEKRVSPLWSKFLDHGWKVADGWMGDWGGVASSQYIRRSKVEMDTRIWSNQYAGTDGSGHPTTIQPATNAETSHGRTRTGWKATDMTPRPPETSWPRRILSGTISGFFIRSLLSCISHKDHIRVSIV